MRFIIIIFVLLFGKSVVANSFCKIYDNEKYDNFRGIAFNDFVLAIATNDSVIFGVVNDEFGFDKIGSKQLTTFVSGENELLEFKFIQKYIVIVCNKYDCCYCKTYDHEGENKCLMLKEGQTQNHHGFTSINIQPEKNVLYIRYISSNHFAYFETYAYFREKYRFMNITEDRLSKKEISFSSLYSFSLGNFFYFITGIEEADFSECLFPKKLETTTDEIYFILSQFCTFDTETDSRIDLMLSCKSSDPHAEKLNARGVVYYKDKDLIRFAIDDTKNYFFCDFKMDKIKKSFCNTWNYCEENPFKAFNKFSKNCQKNEKKYGKRCYKEDASTDFCDKPYLDQKYHDESCQSPEMKKNSYISMENTKALYGLNGDNIWDIKSYGMLTSGKLLTGEWDGQRISFSRTIVLRKRQVPDLFNETVMGYNSTRDFLIFDIDNEKFFAPWDYRNGVLYIDSKTKNSIYFKKTFCPADNCTEYLFETAVACTHQLCNEADECPQHDYYLFCGPLWFNIKEYEKNRIYMNKNRIEKIACLPASNNTQCIYDLQEQHKKFLTAPPAYSPPKKSNTFPRIIWIIIVSVILFLFLLVCILLARKKSLKKQTKNNDPSIIKMSDMNATEIPVVPVFEYDCIDEFGEVNNDKLVKGDIIGKGLFGYVRLQFLISNNKAIKVAVKYLHKPYNEDELIREINSIKSCKHNNIVKFIGWVRNDDGMGIVTEFMEGGNLHSYLINPKKEIKVSQIFSYISQIVDAMVYLHHKMKILHRDIAARNCLLNTAYTVVKVNDFGLAREMDKYYQYYSKNDFPLPVYWFPLEVLEATEHKKFTSKVDIWAFGVLIWEMFERGASPKNGMEFDEFKEFLQSGERLRRPQHCPNKLYDDVMKQCWHFNPKERPTFKTLQERIAIIKNHIENVEPGRMNVVLVHKAANEDETTRGTEDFSAESLNMEVALPVNDVEIDELSRNNTSLKDPLLPHDESN